MPHTISSRSKVGDKPERFFSFDRTDRKPLCYEVKVYAGTESENTLSIEVYEMIGEVEENGERGRFYNPLYGFTITTSRPNTGGFKGTGHGSLGEATLAAFARAAGYGNGGFFLDYHYTYRR